MFLSRETVEMIFIYYYFFIEKKEDLQSYEMFKKGKHYV